MAIPNRRQFLAATATQGITLVAASAVSGTQANSRIELGLIGCGGRGRWIADLFHENNNAHIVAVADYFQDRVDFIGEHLRIDRARRYTGLDGYQRLLKGPLDGVIIETPPYFHPEQTVAALGAASTSIWPNRLPWTCPGPWRSSPPPTRSTIACAAGWISRPG